MILPGPRCLAYLALASVLLLLSALSKTLVALAVLIDIAVLALAVWDGLQLRAASRCVVTRDTPPVYSLGTDNPVFLEVENPGQEDLQVDIFDAFPPQLTARPLHIGGLLPAGGTLQGRYVLQPTTRGDYWFGDLRARFQRPNGFLIRQIRYPARLGVRVYPNVQEIRKHQMLTAQHHVELMGVHRRRQADVSHQFESLREYHPDDDPRDIDWKASARTTSVMVRHYEAEKSQVVMLLLDCGRLMGSRLGALSKLDHAINAVLMLTWLASRNGDRIGLLAFDREVVGYLPPGHGKQQAAKVAQFLYRLEPHRHETDFRVAFSHLAAVWKRRSLVVLFTDLVDPEVSQNLVRHVSLVVPKHRMLCVALSDYELDSVLAPSPTSMTQVYSQAAARTIKADRTAAMAVLRGRGVQSLDAAPNHLTPAVLNRYLALKQAGW